MTVYRWVQRFTPIFAEAARPSRHAVGDRWFPTPRAALCPVAETHEGADTGNAHDRRFGVLCRRSVGLRLPLGQ